MSTESQSSLLDPLASQVGSHTVEISSIKQKLCIVESLSDETEKKANNALSRLDILEIKYQHMENMLSKVDTKTDSIIASLELLKKDKYVAEGLKLAGSNTFKWVELITPALIAIAIAMGMFKV